MELVPVRFAEDKQIDVSHRWPTCPPCRADEVRTKR
jgi:hypothetical protein